MQFRVLIEPETAWISIQCLECTVVDNYKMTDLVQV